MLIRPAETIRVRRPGSKLSRVDFLLIAAIFVVFVITAAAYRVTSVQKDSAALISPDSRDSTSYSPSGDPLLKARIGFARGIGT